MRCFEIAINHTPKKPAKLPMLFSWYAYPGPSYDAAYAVSAVLAIMLCVQLNLKESIVLLLVTIILIGQTPLENFTTAIVPKKPAKLPMLFSWYAYPGPSYDAAYCFSFPQTDSLFLIIPLENFTTAIVQRVSMILIGLLIGFGLNFFVRPQHRHHITVL